MGKEEQEQTTITNTIEIKIKAMDGRSLEVEVNPDITIAELKNIIHQRMSVEPTRQRLICKAKLLQDDKKVSEYVSENGECIHLMVSKNTGSQPQAQQQQAPPQNSQAEGLTRNPQAQRAQPPNPLGNLFGQLFSNMGGVGTERTNITLTTVNPSTIPDAQNRPDQPSNAAGTNPLGGIMNLVQNLQRQPGVTTANTTTIITRSIQPGSRSRSGSSGNIPPGMTREVPPARVPGQPLAFVTRDPRLNHVIGMNSQGIQMNFRHMQNGQFTDDSSVITLPNPALHRMGDHINTLLHIRPQNQPLFPGLPSMNTPRSSLTLLGGYIGTVHHQISMLSPVINRLSQLMEREPFLQDPVERRRLVEMSAHAGRAIRELIVALRPLAEVLSRLRLGDQPNEFGIDMTDANIPGYQNFRDARRPNAQQQSQTASGQHGGQQRQTTTTNARQARQGGNGQAGANPLQDMISQVLGGMQTNQRPSGAQGGQRTGAGQSQQQQANPLAGLMSMAENLVSNMQNQNASQQQQGEQQPENPLAGLLGMFGQAQQQPQAQRQAQQQPQAQRQAQQQPQAQRQAQAPQQPQQAPNPLGDLIGSLLGGMNQQPQATQQQQQPTQERPNQQNETETTTQAPPQNNFMSSMQGLDMGSIFNLTIGEMSERAGLDDDDFESAVLSPLTVSELMQLLQGDSSILDGKHMAMRSSMRDYFLKIGGQEEAKEKFIEMNQQFYTKNLKDSGNILDGFDPDLVMKDVIEKHFDEIIQIIDKHDYTEENKFSTAILAKCKAYTGEMAYEVSEGLVNGIEDFKTSTLKGFGDYATNLTGDPSMGAIFSNIYGNTFWNLILGCYQYHASLVEGGGQNEVDTIIANMQAEAEVDPLDPQLLEQSDAYRQGKLN